MIDAYRRAVPEDAPALLHLFQLCAQEMAERDIHNWRSWLTTPVETLEHDLNTLETYVALHELEIIGTFAIQQTPMAYYDMSLWQSPDHEAVYLRRLAILPECQNQGLGGKYLQYFENLVYKRGYRVVRLDSYPYNEPLVAFYDKRGYIQRGLLHLKIDDPIYADVKTDSLLFEKHLQRTIG